jgi:hypothetical protein
VRRQRIELLGRKSESVVLFQGAANTGVLCNANSRIVAWRLQRNVSTSDVRHSAFRGVAGRRNLPDQPRDTNKVRSAMSMYVMSKRQMVEFFVIRLCSRKTFRCDLGMLPHGCIDIRISHVAGDGEFYLPSSPTHDGSVKPERE